MNMCLYTDLWGNMDTENKENAEELGRSTVELMVQCELGVHILSSS